MGGKDEPPDIQYGGRVVHYIPQQMFNPFTQVTTNFLSLSLLFIAIIAMIILHYYTKVETVYEENFWASSSKCTKNKFHTKNEGQYVSNYLWTFIRKDGKIAIFGDYISTTHFHDY
jgi:hypothetical protein